MQLDVADTRTRKDGSHVVLAYTLDNAIELLKVLSTTLLDTASPCYSYTIHQQAETMHQMVETFEYDGEHFTLRVHAYANTDVLH